MIVVVSNGIGFAIAYCIYRYGDTNKYDLQIAIAKQYDLQWGFLGTWIFAFVAFLLNLYPAIAKSRICPAPNNERSNSFIYVKATEDPQMSSAILMD